jgi:hypothetical protein
MSDKAGEPVVLELRRCVNYKPHTDINKFDKFFAASDIKPITRTLS